MLYLQQSRTDVLCHVSVSVAVQSYSPAHVCHSAHVCHFVSMTGPEPVYSFG